MLVLEVGCLGRYLVMAMVMARVANMAGRETYARLSGGLGRRDHGEGDGREALFGLEVRAMRVI